MKISYFLFYVFSNNPPFKEGHALFPTVPFIGSIMWKISLYLAYEEFNSDNFFIVSAVEICKSLNWENQLKKKFVDIIFIIDPTKLLMIPM